MTDQDQDQEIVAGILGSLPPLEVSPGFLARVNARIDAEHDAGWFGLADFRVWTLRLAPLAAALALIAVLWPATASTSTSSGTAAQGASAAAAFTPASASDWQTDISANALLEAAFSGTANAR